MTLEQPATTDLQLAESTDTEMNHITTDLQVEYDQTQYDEVSTVDSWQALTYQAYDCAFDSTLSNYGISRSFSTGTSFNTTVGESRLHLGIKDDSTKRSNGCENNYFKALKWHVYSGSGDVLCTVFKSGSSGALVGRVYRRVDHCEVNLAPNSLSFNLDGSKIYCGLNNMVEIFDTTRPGKDSTKRPTCPTRRSKKGQKGVISSLAFNPDHSNLYAAGSYLKTIGLYDGRADELLLLLRDKHHNSRKRAKLSNGTSSSTEAGESTTGQSQDQRRPPMGAVTQVQFTPDGLHLYSASRQDSYIRCWDIRNTAQVLHRIERPGDLTNQRLSFDISSDGKWLSTGDMNGDISIFNLENPVDSEIERLTARIRGHEDVVSAAAFHPSNSMLATSSGQRKYDLDLSEPPSSSEDDSNSDSENLQPARRTSPGPSTIRTLETAETTIDNSIRLWSTPGEYKWYVNGQQWTEETVFEHAATETLADDSVPEGEITSIQEDEVLAPE
ncbi:Telomerase Cajal body protein 1 [Mortierella antarctica]|nr:Telomerase Cajal body protein 1 [Mortierella antarctica]